MAQTAQDSFQLARSHLQRVRTSWDDPTDWTILATFGFYCLEACVVAAALHLGWPRPGGHQEKENAAYRLSTNHSLPDVMDLLRDLHEIQKYEAYGDTPPPASLDAEQVAIAIEEYVDSVSRLLAP